MKNHKQLDPYHLQIVSHFFETKQDFLNIIQVKKVYQYLLDRFRINPIPITNETKNLFQFIDTQQMFEEEEEEIKTDNIKILQINYEVTYSESIKKKTKINK